MKLKPRDRFLQAIATRDWWRCGDDALTRRRAVRKIGLFGAVFSIFRKEDRLPRQARDDRLETVSGEAELKGVAAGGGCFSAGSITWPTALLCEPTVSAITRNVIEKFSAE